MAEQAKCEMRNATDLCQQRTDATTFSQCSVLGHIRTPACHMPLTHDDHRPFMELLPVAATDWGWSGIFVR